MKDQLKDSTTANGVTKQTSVQSTDPSKQLQKKIKSEGGADAQMNSDAQADAQNNQG